MSTPRQITTIEVLQAAQEGFVEALRDRYNAHDALVEALEAVCNEIEQLAPQSSMSGIWCRYDRAKELLQQVKG